MTLAVSKLTLGGTMFTSDALAVFKTKAAMAEAAGVSSQAVSQWGELVPPVSAAKLAAKSKGKLKFNADLYADWNNRKRRAS